MPPAARCPPEPLQRGARPRQRPRRPPGPCTSPTRPASSATNACEILAFGFLSTAEVLGVPLLCWPPKSTLSGLKLSHSVPPQRPRTRCQVHVPACVAQELTVTDSKRSLLPLAVLSRGGSWLTVGSCALPSNTKN